MARIRDNPVGGTLGEQIGRELGRLRGSHDDALGTVLARVAQLRAGRIAFPHLWMHQDSHGLLANTITRVRYRDAYATPGITSDGANDQFIAAVACSHLIGWSYAYEANGAGDRRGDLMRHRAGASVSMQNDERRAAGISWTTIGGVRLVDLQPGDAVYVNMWSEVDVTIPNSDRSTLWAVALAEFQ
jgi:hypothetical protein